MHLISHEAWLQCMMDSVCSTQWCIFCMLVASMCTATLSVCVYSSLCANWTIYWPLHYGLKLIGAMICICLHNSKRLYIGLTSIKLKIGAEAEFKQPWLNTENWQLVLEVESCDCWSWKCCSGSLDKILLLLWFYCPPNSWTLG